MSALMKMSILMLVSVPLAVIVITGGAVAFACGDVQSCLRPCSHLPASLAFAPIPAQGTPGLANLKVLKKT